MEKLAKEDQRSRDKRQKRCEERESKIYSVCITAAESWRINERD